jgi:HlyD family secretion protein
LGRKYSGKEENIVKLRVALAAVVVLLVGIALLVYFGQKKAKTEELFYSGTIEAIQSNLAFQTAGRVNTVAVQEGEVVKQGQLLAELDRQELETRYDQVRANQERTVRTREQVATTLAIAEKTLPAEVERAKAAVASARDVFTDSRQNYERYEKLFSRGVVSQKERDAVKLNHDVAKARLTEAEAILSQARSNLSRIQAARADVNVAEAQIAAARAAVSQAGILVRYAELRAPYAGVITSRNVEPGEVVTAGREVLSLADLTTIELKIFVDETEIGKVRPGQRADVKVDTFPDRTFAGVVSFISPEGEFTPKIIQTRKERVKLVYLVKVSLPNPDLALKPGMPADAWLR